MKRRWIRIGSGAGVGIVSIVIFFQTLISLYGFIIVDQTGDIKCEGTLESPCISNFYVRNPNPYNVDIYRKNQVKLKFSPEIEGYALFTKDGRCKKGGTCDCEIFNTTIGFDDWRCVDFTDKTKPRKDRVYVFRFPRYSTKYFKLAGVKKDPTDNIKWSFFAHKNELDPYWKPLIDKTEDCIYNGSGNWKVNCSNNCVWNTPYDIEGNLTLNGNGDVFLNTTFSFTKSESFIMIDKGCSFAIENGGLN